MRITYYGHSCFLLEYSDKKLLLDPLLSSNSHAKDTDTNPIQEDYIFVIHDPTGYEANGALIHQYSTRAKVLSNFEIVEWLGEKGVKSGHVINLSGTIDLDFGTAKMGNTAPSGTFKGNPCGNTLNLVSRPEGKTVYCSEDTVLTYNMKLIGEESPVDFAFLPIGDNFTMGISNTLEEADCVNPSNPIGMHYDTFLEISINPKDAVA